jgi:hypothetical protein
LIEGVVDREIIQHVTLNRMYILRPPVFAPSIEVSPEDYKLRLIPKDLLNTAIETFEERLPHGWRLRQGTIKNSN